MSPARGMAGWNAVFAVRTKIVARLERMIAGDPGDRWLNGINVVRPDIAQAVANRSEGGIDVISIVVDDSEPRQISAPEEGCRLRREAECPGIDMTFARA